MEEEVLTKTRNGRFNLLGVGLGRSERQKRKWLK